VIRGVLYTLSDNTVWLVAVQLLDGIGNGLFGALAPLVLADLMRGTGRYKVARGMVATIQGIGASISNTVAGVIVVWSGYDTALLVLAGVAFLALMLLVLVMPETRSVTEFPAHAQAIDGTIRKSDVARLAPTSPIPVQPVQA
jgi:MFS family permease